MKVTKAHLINWQKHSDLKLDFNEDLNIITGLTDSGKCLTGDTHIPCPITGIYRTINDMIKVSNWKVWSLNKDNKFVVGSVKHILCNGIKDIYCLTVKSGQYIKATYNHKILTNRGWKVLKDINLDDYIACGKELKLHADISNKFSKEQCLLLGYLLGDGSFTNHITFTNAEKTILRNFVKILHKTFGDHHCKRRKIGKATTLEITSPKKLEKRSNYSFNVILNWIRELGLYNLKSTKKYIPKQFFALSNESISYLIAGLFLCDGFVPIKNRILEYCSSSIKLIYQIQTLLLRLGIDSRVRKTSKHYTKNNIKSKKFISYILTISNKNDILKFYKQIPLIGIKKQKLNNLCKLKEQTRQDSHVDIYPPNLVNLLLKIAKNSKYTAKKISEKTGYKVTKSYHLGQFGRSVSYIRGNKIAKLLNNKQLNKLFLSDIKWLKVKNIEKIGQELTYDLEVPFYHNFLANGMIVHNSGLYRSVEWIMGFSNISEKDYRREGTKETSVKIWLDNGFQVERIRSDTINRYILSKENCEDKVFDNFGKNVPEEIQEVFGISTIDIENEHINLNFANQDQINFLLDTNYSDTFKAKLFNKLTGNEKIDFTFKELNKESLRVNREIKENEELVKKQENELADYSLKYRDLKKKLTTVKEHYEKIKEDMAIYEHLKTLSDKLKVNKENEDFVKFKISQIKIVSDSKIKELKNKAEELKKLQTLFYELEAINENLEKIAFQKNNINVVKVNWQQLINDNETLQNLKKLQEQLVQNKSNNKKVTIQIEEMKKLLDNSEKELKEIWKNNPQCPLCGQGVRNDL